jgi:hypothetical protein
MHQPGPAQLDLIRRYARTLRELQSQATHHNGRGVAAHAQRTREQGPRVATVNEGLQAPPAVRGAAPLSRSS